MRARIVIIEDNPTNLQLMVYLLEECGHVVETAGDGATGVTLARRTAPDLVVSDLHMPVLDGFAVARQLKSDPLPGNPPLLAVTAFAMEKDRVEALAAGFDGFITKPIEPGEFLRTLETHLPPEKRGQPVRQGQVP